MNKGQGSEIFIYALTAVITVLLLIVGYKTIAGMKGSSDRISIVDFKSDFSRDLDLDSTFGTVKTHKYKVPLMFNEICLIDTNQTGAGVDIDRYEYPIIYDSWRHGARENVFLLPNGEPFQASNMTFGDTDGDRLANHHLCLQIQQGWFSVRFRGKGVVTMVERE